MSTATVELPESLKNRIEALAAKEGYSVSQFLASAAGEKLAAMLTVDFLRREASAGRREDFDKYLAAVPDVAAQENDLIDGPILQPGTRPPQAKKRNQRATQKPTSKVGERPINPKSPRSANNKKRPGK